MSAVFQSLSAARVSKVSSTYSDDDDLPWPSKVSIAAFAVYGLAVLVSMWWYSCKRVYAQGSRIGLPRGCRDGRVMQPTTMLVCGIIGICLKIVALAVDWWSTYSATSSDDYHFGSFAASGGGSPIKYADLDAQCWHVIAATSAFSFAAVLLSTLVSLYVQLTLGQMRAGASAVALRAERLYRSSGIVSMLTATGWSMWIFGQWIFLLWQATQNTSYNSGYSAWVWPGVSAYCTMAAMIFDSVVHSSGKATLLNTPPYGAVALGQPFMAAQQQQQVVYAVPVGQQYQAYAPAPQGVAYGVPQQHLQQQQQQPQQQGYVQPAAYGQQHGGYVQQPQQTYTNPPAYAPQANFAGQPQRVAPQPQAYPQL